VSDGLYLNLEEVSGLRSSSPSWWSFSSIRGQTCRTRTARDRLGCSAQPPNGRCSELWHDHSCTRHKREQPDLVSQAQQAEPGVRAPLWSEAKPISTASNSVENAQISTPTTSRPSFAKSPR